MAIPPNTRTFLPKLLTILLLVCNYIGRYRVTILKYLPEGSDIAVDAVLDACDVLRIIVETELDPDTP